MLTFLQSRVDITTKDTFHSQVLDKDTLQYIYIMGRLLPVLIQGRGDWGGGIKNTEKMKFGMGKASKTLV